jgi:ABC-type nickel/cobalt efflux system permease component RcnA
LVELCAGLIVSLCGIALFCRAVRHRRGARHSDCCSCNHAPPGNKHLPLIGFLIGLVPCPGAIAVSLYATKTDSFMQALLLSLLFALGVAVTLSGLGMLITHSSHKAGGYSGKLASFKHVLPFISPAMINTLGLIMIFHSSTH